MIYQLLAKEYGFTAADVGKLTPYQTLMYLNDREANDYGFNLSESQLKGFKRKVDASNELLADSILRRMTDV